MSTGSRWVIEDLPEETPRRRRRVSGHWGPVILLAVLVAVAAAAGMRPRVLTGSGDMRVGLVLPAPGECLRWDVDTSDPPSVIVAHPEFPLPVVPGTLAPASCSSPHEGQVVRAWRWVAVDVQRAQRRCIDAGVSVNAYLPEQSASGWSTINGERRASMVRTGTAPTDYVACVLIEVPSGLPPAVFTLTAPLTPDSSAGPRWCLTAREQAIGCDRDHRFERIGIADEPRGDPSCATFAEQLVAAGADAFADTGLTIRSGMLPGTYGPTWFCDVVAPPGQQLTASVVGLGSDRLPVG